MAAPRPPRQRPKPAALAASIADALGISLAAPVEANGVFLDLSADAQERLRAIGWHFYGFIGDASRFMFTWDSQIERVDALARDIWRARYRPLPRGEIRSAWQC